MFNLNDVRNVGQVCDNENLNIRLMAIDGISCNIGGELIIDISQQNLRQSFIIKQAAICSL